MAQETSFTRQHSNAYNIFMLVLTVLSLGIMVVLLLPLSSETIALLQVYDNVVCIIFLIDFFMNLGGSRPKSGYFIHERGWLDLLGSIPSFGILRLTALLRLFRLSRLARISRLLRGKNKEALIKDVIENRGQYTLFITILLTLLVLTVASVLVLQFESQSPDANIHSGGDSLWYSIVTITTVGYGDRYPVTPGGRITAVFIMFMGVGIIGALASILSSVLVGSPPAAAEEPAPEAAPVSVAGTSSAVEHDITAIKEELAALRLLMEKMAAQKDTP
jgi:voltage-gated potassium channel